MPEGKIKILPESLSNKIAAGEVIDRPSSVVKELVENAIDANADEITIIVRDGGKTLIQVIDNGNGMEESDAILAFERHSTSKIAHPEDLNCIQSMGFRGEALASIGSVSRVEMRTCTEEKMAATRINIEAGVIKDLSQTAGKRGTSIAVKNLFFSTPARRKFLKSDQAEYRHILKVVTRYFLSYPEISFHFYKNDSEIFNLPAANLKPRISQVYGEKFGGNIVEVVYDQPDGKVRGFVGNMDLFRRSRGDQFIFLNKRYIQNKNLNWAVVNAYQSMLPQGRYPFYALFLQIDPERVDVNVHPSKIEVRFEDERRIFGLVHRAVKEALQKGEVVPVLQTQTDAINREYKTVPLTGQSQDSPTDTHSKTSFQSPKKGRDMAFQFEFRKEKREFSLIPGKKEEQKEQEEESPVQAEDALQEKVSVWQLHNKYILSQIKSGLIIIDQHLAHERILYERVLKLFEESRSTSQQQLFPKTVSLSPEDFDILLEMQFYLSRIGFIVKEFGKQTVVVEAIPAELQNRDEEKLLREIIDEYKQSKEPDIREKIATSFACKSAIKAGDYLNQDEIVALIDNLFATQNPYFCPHGRPIIVTIPMEELDRRFLRI